MRPARLPGEESTIKSALARLSLVKQIILLMLLLGLLGVTGMSVASWMAQSIQGNAHAINKAGSLRMQSYRLLAMLPLTSKDDAYLRQIETDQNSIELSNAVTREGLKTQYAAILDYWQRSLKPELEKSSRPQQAKPEVAEFVSQLDTLVAALDQKTEHHLMLITLVQAAGIALTLIFLLLTLYFLRLRLQKPWQQLLTQANAVTQGDFTQRYLHGEVHTNTAKNEMDLLGEALDSMSAALAEMVDSLAQRVEEKTRSLLQKNQILDFLYRVSRQLHTSQSLEKKLPQVLQELQNLTPLRAIQLRLYDNNSAEFFHEIDSQKSPSPRLAWGEAEAFPELEESASLNWRLRDGDENYGLLLATLPYGQVLTHDQQQLIGTLLEQLASALTLDRQTDNHQQLMLMEERSTIARELHDSLAQSLSCLKIQVACLQMKSPSPNEENTLLIKQMREELNTAYSQLRELLTTFRLKLTAPGLRSALQHTVDEFTTRLGLQVTFDYQLPPRLIPANQGVHLLHIAREALNNIYKHAAATQVSLSLNHENGQVTMQIADNGSGLPAEALRQNHYGLMIMRDRASSLQGECQVTSRDGGGTLVRVKFCPDSSPFTHKEHL
ncbi:nitrate/nitrite sensor protein NarX [Serratia sp. Leaf50]|nr:nitrate/nitrite sensor protein NarX [Serratia sp. Leaf50]